MHEHISCAHYFVPVFLQATPATFSPSVLAIFDLKGYIFASWELTLTSRGPPRYSDPVPFTIIASSLITGT